MFLIYSASGAKTWLESRFGSTEDTVTSLVESSLWPHVQAEIDRALERANSKAISRAAGVKRWRLIEKDFTLGGGELSPSLKLKRFHVAKMYEKEIEEMYEN